jgi:predicted SAM-dependent methyltransferase
VLHVGCGPYNPKKLHEAFRKEGWRELRVDINPNVKPDIVASMLAMPMIAGASVDGVWSSHNIEHLYAHEVPVALAEFLRVLRPGGVVLLTMPDLQRVAELIVQDKLDEPAYSSPAVRSRRSTSSTATVRRSPWQRLHGASHRLHRAHARAGAGQRRLRSHQGRARQELRSLGCRLQAGAGLSLKSRA